MIEQQQREVHLSNTEIMFVYIVRKRESSPAETIATSSAKCSLMVTLPDMGPSFLSPHSNVQL